MAAGPGSKLLPSTVDDFRSPAFWRTFFEARGGKAFEWYGTFSNFARNLTAALPLRTSRILVIGCGNSKMSAELYAAGYTDVVNVDFDAGVIEEMRRKYKDSCPRMRWEVMDVTRMASLGDGSFDAVLDKGTMDAMFHGESPEVVASIDSMVGEVHRILAPGGLYMVITLAQDHLLAHWGRRMAAGVPALWGSAQVDTFASPDLSSNRCQFVLSARRAGGAGLGVDSGLAVVPGTFALAVHAPRSFEDAPTPDDSAPAAASGAGGGATSSKKGGKGKAGGAAAATTSAAASEPASASPAAAADAARPAAVVPVPEWICTHGGGEDVTHVFFPRPAAAAAAAGGAGASAAAAAGPEEAEAVRRLQSEVAAVQWSYDTARTVASVHPDNHLSVDVWVVPAKGSGGSGGAAAGGAGSGAPAPSATIVVPAGTKPRIAAADADGSGDAASSSEAWRRFPRFTITLCDVSLAPSAAVVLVPQGREHEWLFSTREGQKQIAQSARSFGRLIFVALGRGHSFSGGPKGVQAELSPIVTRFLPAALRPAPTGGAKGKGKASGGAGSGFAAGAAAVPYLAVADDIGARDLVAQGTSLLSGAWVVEDVEVDSDEDDEDGAPSLAAALAAGEGDDDEYEPSAASAAVSAAPSPSSAPADSAGKGGKAGKGKTAAAAPAAKQSKGQPRRRRLVFLSNRNAVQSEAALVSSVAGVAAAAGASRGCARSFGPLAAAPASPLCIDRARLCFEYQQGMAALVRLFCAAQASGSGAATAASSVAARPLRVCVVGLGSGALVSFLASVPPPAVAAASAGRFSSIALTAVELDGAVVDLARIHFGFTCNSVAALADAPVAADAGAAEAGGSAEAAAARNMVQVLVGDGLAHMERQAAAAASSASASSASASASPALASSGPAADVLVIDVDAKDLTTAISFPPPAFLARAALAHMRAMISSGNSTVTAGVATASDAGSGSAAAPSESPGMCCGADRGGVALINFSCRSAPLKSAVLASLQRAFAPTAATDSGSVVMEVSLAAVVPDATNSLLAVTASPAVAAEMAAAAAAAAAAADGAGRAGRAWAHYCREWAPLLKLHPQAAPASK